MITRARLDELDEWHRTLSISSYSMAEVPVLKGSSSLSREFSSPQIPRAHQVESCFVTERTSSASINEDKYSDMNKNVIENEEISAVMEPREFSSGLDGIGYCIFKKFSEERIQLSDSFVQSLICIWSLSKTISSKSSIYSS